MELSNQDLWWPHNYGFQIHQINPFSPKLFFQDMLSEQWMEPEQPHACWENTDSLKSSLVCFHIYMTLIGIMHLLTQWYSSPFPFHLALSAPKRCLILHVMYHACFTVPPHSVINGNQDFVWARHILSS